MKKILPNLYKGKVKNNLQNQKQSFVKTIEEEISNIKPENTIEDKNINRQIKDIFSSPNYVYKADVSIVMADGKNLKKTIIGRTNNSLITIDDELIDVSQISQINFLN